MQEAIPVSLPLYDVLDVTPNISNNKPYIKTIALIGAFHDGKGNIFEDDVQLLDNAVTYLEKSGISVAAHAHVLPMTLRQNEDIMKVQPQVDLAILCYIYDDQIDRFSDRPNRSFLAQSASIKGKTGDERYNAWQDALQNTNAKIILSLGHPEEISAKKARPENFRLIIDPEKGTDEIPPMLSKQTHKQKSYGIAMRNDCLAKLAELTNENTELGKSVKENAGQENTLALL